MATGDEQLAAKGRALRSEAQRLLASIERASTPVLVRDLAEGIAVPIAESYGGRSEDARETAEAWEALGELESVVSQPLFVYEAFHLQVFATHHAVDLCLDDPERSRVREEVTAVLGWWPSRLRWGTPSPRAMGRRVASYSECLAEGSGVDGGYVAVAERFADLCGTQVEDPLAYAGHRPRVAEAGLDLLRRTICGCIVALRSWEIV